MEKLKDWYQAHSEEDKKFFKDSIIAVFLLLVMMVIVLVTEEEHSDYFYVQNGLFLVLLMFVILILIRRNGLVEIIRNTFTFTKKENITINDLSDVVFTVSIVLVLVSFLFVLDVSFFSENGIKIGGVVAVSLAGLLNSFRHTFKN